MALDIPALAISALKILRKAFDLVEQKRLQKDIEAMREAAANSPSMLEWRAVPGTPEYDLYERMVKAKLLVRSAMFPHSYNLPTRYH